MVKNNTGKSDEEDQNGVAVIYSRVSSAQQSEEGHSLEAQRQNCQRWIDYKEYTMLGSFEDAGVSGSKADRKGLVNAIKCLDDVKEDVKKVLVFYSLSRLSRNMCHFIDLYRELNKKKITMYSIKESIDYSSSTGEAMVFMLSTFANLERRQIGERTRDTLQNIKQQGRWIGRAPYGYRVDEESGKLKPNQEELDRVSRIFAMKDDRYSLSDIAKSEGITYHRIWELCKLRKKYEGEYIDYALH